MACEMCEHCHAPVFQDQPYTVRDGCSYHEKCHKCYVCSETNLHDAEVFKGVIFCNSCSQRIFQGCSTARRQKTGRRDKARKRRSPRTEDRRARRGILELTTLAVSTDGSNASDPQKKQSDVTSKGASALTSRPSKTVTNTKTNSMKKISVEMGMTTDVTQELLKQMKCPVVTDCRKPTHLDKPETKLNGRRRKKQDCSDLRIAELGASTEIANMALRNKSELPVIIRSDTRLGKMESLSGSALNQESGESGQHEEWMDSAYSSLRYSVRTHWMDRRLSSILKLPYKAFKRNILDRSSLIKELTSCEDSTFALKKKIKLMFYEEITDHQRRGLKRLYSTINRKKAPNKLGWLDVVAKVSAENQIKRCKHFKKSHSYRCMRSQVMRLAGPTANELAEFRSKIKSYLAPSFIRNIAAYNKKYAAIMMSQACGNSLAGSNQV